MPFDVDMADDKRDVREIDDTQCQFELGLILDR